MPILLADRKQGQGRQQQRVLPQQEIKETAEAHSLHIEHHATYMI